ncbi:hypothetical protein EVAR_34834_1 [Eumeta japonica]|uniref:Uncharacterized protein n=1 Tax=Eumeta variegata TaxID=151549 RepID=A0A4C1YYN9_EUMVA|nr:hypothetical protein EVAR_34834_1 [Eumeta japonica]
MMESGLQGETTPAQSPLMHGQVQCSLLQVLKGKLRRRLRTLTSDEIYGIYRKVSNDPKLEGLLVAIKEQFLSINLSGVASTGGAWGGYRTVTPEVSRSSYAICHSFTNCYRVSPLKGCAQYGPPPPPPSARYAIADYYSPDDAGAETIRKYGMEVLR